MPIVSFPVGRRRFAPSWLMTALTIALCVVFVRLGEWQWQRGEHRQAEWDAFARGADAPVPLGGQELRALPRFKHVTVIGTWDAGHQFLILAPALFGRKLREIAVLRAVTAAIIMPGDTDARLAVVAE